MGFFRSLKGDHPKIVGSSPENTNTYSPPSGPPPTYRQRHASKTTSAAEHEPPPGPPNCEEYEPPPGPPPTHPKASAEPPPYHDWTVIPDTALLPPPPELGHDASPSGNASTYDADRAKRWCQMNPIIRPHQPTLQQHASVRDGEVHLIKPREYSGDIFTTSTGMWKGSTRPESKEACLLTSFPLYFACADSPLNTEARKTVYFEIKIRAIDRRRSNDESSIALGYCSIPYPAWRMPGWERGSLGVRMYCSESFSPLCSANSAIPTDGDDGRKYVNDSWGGKNFTSAFREGETIGLGITFSVPDLSTMDAPPPVIGTMLRAQSKVEVFMTRDGKIEGGWNLHEELDADNDRGIEGLEGDFDLYGAIGTYGQVQFDVNFNRRDWRWQPR